MGVPRLMDDRRSNKQYDNNKGHQKSFEYENSKF